MAVTTTREVFVSKVVILRPGGVASDQNVRVRTTELPRGRMEVVFHVDDKKVEVTLSHSDRRALIKALGGTAS